MAVLANWVVERNPEIVDVAVVEVATNELKVGVLVATIAPLALVERSELMLVPDIVSDGEEKDEVATNDEAVTVPPSK